MESSRWADPSYANTSTSAAGHTFPSQNIDEFAQTRSPDDLFSDDFTPISEPETTSTPAQPFPQRRQEPGGYRGAPRGRSNRRGGGLRTDNPRNEPPRMTNSRETSTVLPNDIGGEPATSSGPAEPGATDVSSPNETPSKTATALRSAVPAVRGDRTATGGVKREKLTAEELTARMEAMELKNASLVAAHERANADEEAFQVREAEALERRRIERHNRQELMGERERNARRKLQAQGGREWDEGKAGEETEARGKGFRRGAFGGVSGGPRREGMSSNGGSESTAPALDAGDLFSPERRGNDYGGYRGRGRGARGEGRGRGRGGFDDRQIHHGQGTQQQQRSKATQQVPNVSDFPALPGAKKSEPKLEQQVEGQSEQLVKGQSWAEEMENTPIASANT